MPQLLMQAAPAAAISALPGSAATDEVWLEAYDAVRQDSVAWAAPEAVVTPGHALAPFKAIVPPPDDHLWSSTRVRAPEALALVPPDPEVAWIGHADTGWGRHYQLPRSRLDLDNSLDVFSGLNDAEDPLEFIDMFDGHGVGTAALMISGDDDHLAPEDGIPDDVRGLCPNARLTPVRCANSVVLFSDLALTRAIDHLARLGVDVISISLGGLPSPLLHRAVTRAIHDHQVIVIAAGGQRFPVVPYPAAYDECIAVAATTTDDRPWESTTGGKSITIAAPGHQVLTADFGPERAEIVKSGAGTSYATPHVSAAAALWLEYHGRARLGERYAGAQPMQEVFREVLVGSARVPDPSWRGDRHGAGILDMKALLEMPLPPQRRSHRAHLPTPLQHDLAALGDALGISASQADATMRRSARVAPAEYPVAVSEVLRDVMSLPAEEVSALRSSVARGAPGAQVEALADRLPTAVAPLASPHLANRLE